MFVPAPGVDQALLGWWARWVRKGRRTRARFSGPDAAWILTYTRRYRVTVALIFLGFSALYAVAYLGRVVPVVTLLDVLVLIASIAFWVFVTGIFVASLMEEVRITERGVRRRSWHGVDEMPWTIVASVRVSVEMHRVTLRGSSGSTLHVSLYLDGLESFQEALAAHHLNPVPSSLPVEASAGR